MRLTNGQMRLCGLLPVLLTAAAEPGLGQTTLTRVAIAGEPLTNGGTFTFVADATIGPGGHVAGSGTINSGTVGGAVTGLAGQPLTRVLAEGDLAPGTPAGVTFGLVNELWPDASGRVLVSALLNGAGVTGASNSGLWLWESGALRLIARRGTEPVTASLLPAGTVLSSLGMPAFAAGRVLFAATLSGPNITNDNNRSLWLYEGTTLTMLLQEGTASGSGVVAGANWVNFGDPVLNAAGFAAFQALVNTGSTANDGVIVAGSLPGPFALVAREGAAAPGAPVGVVFSGDFALAATSLNEAMSVNNAGEVMFRAVVSGTGVNTTNDRGMWRRTGLVTSLISRESDPAPGFPAPQLVLGEPTGARIGSGGALVWRAPLAGSGVATADDTAVYRRIGVVSPTTAVILREGDQAPGEAAGVVFAGPPSATSDARPAVNGSGQMFIEAAVNGPSLPGVRTGYWCNDPTFPSGTSQLRKLVRIGDTVTLVGVAGVTTAQVTGITPPILGDTQSGHPTAIADDGRAVIFCTLSTGAGPINGLFSVRFSEPATTGACCGGATCSLLTQPACTGANTRFAGTGTACNVFGTNNTTPCCFADFNGVGGVTVQDIFDYLVAYFAAGASADINGAGGVTVQDIFDFLGAYFSGCG